MFCWGSFFGRQYFAPSLPTNFFGKSFMDLICDQWIWNLCIEAQTKTVIYIRPKLLQLAISSFFYFFIFFIFLFSFARQYFELCYVVPTNFFFGKSFMDLICDQWILNLCIEAQTKTVINIRPKLLLLAISSFIYFWQTCSEINVQYQNELWLNNSGTCSRFSKDVKNAIILWSQTIAKQNNTRDGQL